MEIFKELRDKENQDIRLINTLINGVPGFKCLQLVGTLGKDGHSNLGLFNSIFHVGASPALLGMVFRPGSKDHDTLANILATGCYTFNNVLAPFLKNAHQTSARYETGRSEFVACGLEEYLDPDFQAPFVASSTIKIALELREVIPVKLNNTTIVIGEVKQIHLSDGILGTDGYIDHQLAGTLTVAGLDSYFKPVAIDRFAYAKPDQLLKSVVAPPVPSHQSDSII